MTNPIPAVVDPFGATLHLAVGLLGHLVDSARTDVGAVLDKYLFTTVDVASPGMNPLTSNLALQHLNGGFAIAADTLLTATVVFASLRGMFERSMRARYSLKIVIPRVMLALILVHGSLAFMQMAIDLNNAMSHVATSIGTPLTADGLPWAASMSSAAIQQLMLSQDIFHALFAVAVVVAVVVLMLAYVVRGALLNVLIATAPIAALLTVLPDTRSYARSWLRLFLVTVFMQAVQVIVLRVATTTSLDQGPGIVASLYGLATVWLVLKVPGALNTASHLETKAKTLSHGLERSVKRAHGGTHTAVHRKSA